MRTAHLPTVHASVAIRRQYWEGGGPMNKFEQISSDDHQISLAGGSTPAREVFPMPMSRGGPVQ